MKVFKKLGLIIVLILLSFFTYDQKIEAAGFTIEGEIDNVIYKIRNVEFETRSDQKVAVKGEVAFISTSRGEVSDEKIKKDIYIDREEPGLNKALPLSKNLFKVSPQYSYSTNPKYYEFTAIVNEYYNVGTNQKARSPEMQLCLKDGLPNTCTGWFNLYQWDTTKISFTQLENKKPISISYNQSTKELVIKSSPLFTNAKLPTGAQVPKALRSQYVIFTGDGSKDSDYLGGKKGEGFPFYLPNYEYGKKGLTATYTLPVDGLSPLDKYNIYILFNEPTYDLEEGVLGSRINIKSPTESFIISDLIPVQYNFTLEQLPNDAAPIATILKVNAKVTPTHPYKKGRISSREVQLGVALPLPATALPNQKDISKTPLEIGKTSNVQFSFLKNSPILTANKYTLQPVVVDPLLPQKNIAASEKKWEVLRQSDGTYKIGNSSNIPNLNPKPEDNSGTGGGNSSGGTDTPDDGSGGTGGGSEGNTPKPPEQPKKDPVLLKNPLRAGLDTIPAIAGAIVENIVIPIALPFLAMSIIWTGFLFVKARGKPDEITKAREALKWTIIGGLLILGSFLIATALQGTIKDIMGR